MKRRVCYVTGTRADFGLMSSTLQRMNSDSRIALGIAVTGMHLDPRYGSTVKEIEAAGLRMDVQIPVDLKTTSGASMARSIGTITLALVNEFERARPDLVLVLGDRGEMLAATIAASHLEIPVAHIHGGERSGTIDEPVRHAISKLAHLHFVSSQDSMQRLIRMGEDPSRIWVTGAPGLDDMQNLQRAPRGCLAADLELDANRRIALFVYHPVLHEANFSATEAEAILAAIAAAGLQALALAPNADAGSTQVRDMLERKARAGDIKLLVHLERAAFLSWLAACDVVVGNSSAGIIEAASFGTPVVNIGTRQANRLRNANVVDVASDEPYLAQVIGRAATGPRYSGSNVYGDGSAGIRITELVATVDLGPGLVVKTNAY